jgi:hypothetical protein
MKPRQKIGLLLLPLVLSGFVLAVCGYIAPVFVVISIFLLDVCLILMTQWTEE